MLLELSAPPHEKTYGCECHRYNNFNRAVQHEEWVIAVAILALQAINAFLYLLDLLVSSVVRLAGQIAPTISCYLCFHSSKAFVCHNWGHCYFK